MPQINRIRVNNVKYNFGTQFYDDFVMRFSGRNTIYDLANGGGKSVLMLLLMQNMIPNCTLDEKQPVEKLFRSGNDNTTIHSLIEWKLDSCDVHNGYQYMTTGFCARKGRDLGEEADGQTQTANIEYYNYCIFYREFGENDLKNLPLSKNGERVTYNGLKSYLRDLEKRDFGVEVHIFDRKGDYQAFIRQYGLYESQWEIIRGINKTEGHVRTYFENNYKTTRKIIEDLLIEGIIEKSYHSRTGTGEGDASMAQTLLDIKDQLMELSKRKNEMQRYDEQMTLLTEFSGRIGAVKKLYMDKKQVEEELLAYLLACRNQLSGKEQQSAVLERQIDEIKEKQREESRLIACAEIEVDAADVKQLEALIAETVQKRDEQLAELKSRKEELRQREIAAEYEDYRKYKKQYDETKELLKSKDVGKEEAAAALTRLAATKALLIAPQIASLQETIAQKKEQLVQDTEQLTRAETEKKDLYGQIRMEEGKKAAFLKEEAKVNGLLEEQMNALQIFVSSQIAERAEETRERIEKAGRNKEEWKRLLQTQTEKLAAFKQELAQMDAGLSMTGEAVDRLKMRLRTAEEYGKKIQELRKVYHAASQEALLDTIYQLYQDLEHSLWENRRQEQKLERQMEQLKAGELPDYETEYRNVLSYLQNRYEDVMSGAEYLKQLSKEDAGEVVKKLPLLPYAVIAGESYEKIRQDQTLYRLETGSGIIPILHRLDTDIAAPETKEAMFAFRDRSYLWEDAGLNGAIAKCREDHAHLAEQIRKLEDRFEIVEADYRFMLTASGGETAADCEAELKNLREQYAKLEADKKETLVKTETLRQKLEESEAKIAQGETELSGLQQELQRLIRTEALQKQLSELTAEIRQSETMRSELGRAYHNSVDAVRALKQQNGTLADQLNQSKQRLQQIQEDFSKQYQAYFDQNALPYDGMTEEEADAKAGALRRRVSEEMGEIADKEKLLAAYEVSMKKCAEQIRYRGMSLQEAEQAYDSGNLLRLDLEQMITAKDEIERLNLAGKETERELDAQSAQKNRLEGGIAHAVSQYEAKFGPYVQEQVLHPQEYIAAHKQQSKLLQQQMETVCAQMKQLEAENKEILLMEKDLERIVRNAGLAVPEHGQTAEELPQQELNIQAYETVQTQYERILREENKRCNTFAEEKQKLIEALQAQNAFELAEEIRRSLVFPQTAADVDEMVRGLHETNDCIALERDSIEQGIADMERIKDSFEERCIQICENIRTELDRLPKLSRITLDDEVVSMITLSVPYIKEELYKDRMSVYINETAAGAQTFSSQEEKLKYIRNKLSWKKLFSVIVTDMNSIRLCLYKREHIKDQSRYLRYEEAVGSTGQSQGIYIQFLTAVIHYISSINAAGKDTAVIGKTIFIDNPFGAAKDVYIWEPIFKLLKTNHVQLIVPARGATPAITGMFDVNYVLGQRMTGARLQTVVVDYHSQVRGEEMDYSVLEYEQATLKLD